MSLSAGLPAECQSDAALPQEAQRAFAARFGRMPTFAAAAPGRVNLIGEHTDYNQGFVLPIAIERRTVIVAAVSRSDRSTLAAPDLGETFAADLTAAIGAMSAGPASYLLGVAREFQRLGHRLPNLDALIMSTVPVGAGLSSSAAVEVAFATLLAQVVGVALDPLATALLCQRAEQEFAGTPCGIMDMYAASAARPDHALFIDCRSNEVKHVPIRLTEAGREAARLLIVNSGVRRGLAGAQSEYAARRGQCETAAAKLRVSSLRDATLDLLARAGGALTEIERRRALHVIAENSRTLLAAVALAAGDVVRVGELMFASHDSLRDLFEVSCPELDCIVDAANEMHHQGRSVCGARMTGAGFGGCAIVLCRGDAVSEVAAHLTRHFADRFGRLPEIFTTAAAGCATVLPCAR